MTIVADHYRFVVGVDTHAATHSYAVVESPTGRIIDQATFPTTTAGLARAQAWIGRRTEGEIDTVLIAAEGTGSYGAIAADKLEHAGYRPRSCPATTSRTNTAAGSRNRCTARRKCGLICNVNESRWRAALLSG
ncbi:hypothetical protein ABIA39_009094 [Nocardia sp. GAS34]